MKDDKVQVIIHSLFENMRGVGLLDEPAYDALVKTLRRVPSKGNKTREIRIEQVLVKLNKHFKKPLPIAKSDNEVGVLYRISRLLEKEQDRKTFLEDLLNEVHQVVPFDSATIFIEGEDDEGIEPVCTWGQTVDLIQDFKFGGGSGFSSWLAASGRPILLSELHGSGMQTSRSIRSFMAFPLASRGSSYGAFHLGHGDTGFFTQEHFEILKLIVRQVSSTIERYLHFHRFIELSYTDDLTSLYNRRYIQKKLDEETARSRRYNRLFSLIMIDIDHFKTYNDRFGHPTGDLVLKEISELLINNVRRSDTVGRFGGEEFLVILPETSLAHAKLLASRLRRGISLLHRRIDTSLNTPVTASFGVSSWGGNPKAPCNILETVDQALYKAKSNGRNRVEYCRAG